jgi:multisubunit Na+/H+ antiporter MnhB subunit
MTTDILLLSMFEQRPEKGPVLDELLEFAMWGLVGLMVAWFAWTLSAGLIERLFLFDGSLIGQLSYVGSVAVFSAVLVSIILFGVARPLERRLTAVLK